MHFRDIFTCTLIHVNKCDHNVHRMWQTMREWLQRKEGSQLWYTVQTRLSYISRRKCEHMVLFVVLDNLVIPSIWTFMSTYVCVSFRELNKTTTFIEFIQQVYYYIFHSYLKFSSLLMPQTVWIMLVYNTHVCFSCEKAYMFLIAAARFTALLVRRWF